MHWHAADGQKQSLIQEQIALIQTLAGSVLHKEDSAARIEDAASHFENAAVFVNPGVCAAVPNIIDPEKEKQRLTRELKRIEKDLGVLEKKLGNANFTARAPAEVVEKSKQQASDLTEKRDQLQAALARLS